MSIIYLTKNNMYNSLQPVLWTNEETKMTTKKMYLGITIVVIVMILSAGCTYCKPACPTCGTTAQMKITGTIEKIEKGRYSLSVDIYYVSIILIGNKKLRFEKESDGSETILIRSWSEVDSLTIGKQYQWLLEKDISCGYDARPWTLVNVTEI
jgi:hypothetical protein